MKKLLIFLAVVFQLPNKFVSHQLHSRIYNGVPSTVEDAKHQVSLRNKILNQLFFGHGHFCGGVLISRNLVLTAAHCFLTKNPYFYSIVMGSLVKNVKDNGTLVFDAVEIFAHPLYDEETISYDIGLIILAQSVPAELPNIQPIQLVNYSMRDGTVCYVSGWGKTELNVLSDNLLTADVPIIPISMCNESYDGLLMPGGQICAGYMAGVKDACEGDSGGPLVCEGLLTGIVSGGSGCGLENKPGVYVDVYFFREWIRGEATRRNITLEGNRARANIPSLAAVGALLFSLNVVINILMLGLK